MYLKTGFYDFFYKREKLANPLYKSKGERGRSYFATGHWQGKRLNGEFETGQQDASHIEVSPFPVKTWQN